MGSPQGISYNLGVSNVIQTALLGGVPPQSGGMFIAIGFPQILTPLGVKCVLRGEDTLNS